MPHLLLYGGTFDPIHHGHLITSRAACELLRADQVLFLPAKLSPHKQDEPPGASAEQRLHMIQLAIAGQSDYAVDEREFSREGPSYTIDTLAELERDRPQDRFTLLLGADQLPKLHTWHKVHELLAQVPVAILGRSSNRPFEQLIAPIEEYLGSSTAQRFRRAVLLTPLIDISASNVRERVRNNLPITHLVPESVAAFIASSGLYR